MVMDTAAKGAKDTDAQFSGRICVQQVQMYLFTLKEPKINKRGRVDSNLTKAKANKSYFQVSRATSPGK